MLPFGHSLIAACLAATVSFTVTCSSAAADTVRIGVSAPLTGIQAPSGVDVATHLKAAVTELTERGEFGAHKVELTILDDGYDTDRTRSNVATLITKNRVHLLMNQIGSAHINAALPVIQASNVTLFAPLSGPANLYAEALRPSVVPLRASYSDEVRQQIRMLRAMGVSEVVIVYQDDAYGQDILKAWSTHSEGPHGNGLTVSARLAVTRGNADVEAVVDTALARKPGAVVLALVSTPALRAAQHVRGRTGGGVYAVMMSVAATSEVIAALRSSGRGAVLFSSVMPLPTAGTNRLLLDYAELRKKYRLEPSFRGLEAYVALRIVGEQLRRMNSVTPQSLGQALAAAPSFLVGDTMVRTREPRYAEVFAITKAGVL